MKNLEKKIILFGVYVFLSWSTINSMLLMMTKVFEDDQMYGVGPFQFAIYFGTVLLFTFCFNAIEINFKLQIFLSSFPAIFNFICIFIALNVQTLNVKVFVGVGAVFGGISNTYLNIVMGKYLSFLCEEEPINIKGHYFGIGIMFFGGANFGSAMLSYVGEGLFGPNTYIILLMVVALLSGIYGMFIVQNKKQFENKFELRKILEESKKIIQYYPKMKNTIFLVALDGLSIGFITSSMIHLLPADQSSDKIASLSTFCFAFGSILTTYLSTRLSDLITYRVEGMLIVVWFFICCVFSLLAYHEQKLWLSLVVIFGWGSFVFLVEGFMNVICCKAYDSDPESFVVNRQVRGVFQVLYSLGVVITNNQTSLFLLIIYLMLGCIPALAMVVVWKPLKQYEKSLTEQK